MKFVIKVANKDLSNIHEEEYDQNIDNPEEWAKEIIKRYNETLYEGDKERVLLGVRILNKFSIKDHEWQKINLVTVKRNGAYCDLYKCSRCEITGKLFGLGGSIRLDPKYQRNKAYLRCDTSLRLQIQKGKIKRTPVK